MIQKFDTLYARDSKGKVLKWNIEVTNTTGGATDIKMSYGQYDGAQAIRWQRNIQGKNIGKSNETNPYEQAVLEVESTIRNKKKKGYMTFEEVQELSKQIGLLPQIKKVMYKFTGSAPKDTVYDTLNTLLPKNRTDANGDVKPMKAQQYYRTRKNWTDPDGKVWTDRKYYYLLNPSKEKEAGSIITKFPCMGQPKINGVRATIKLVDNRVVIKSKEGKIYNVAHIEDFLNINNDIFDNASVLDGELYIHGELLQDIGSAVNKPNLNTPRITFVLFDIAVEDLTNKERFNVIKNDIKPKLAQHLNCPIQVITTIQVNNDNHAQKYTDHCIEKGYEGIILRQFDGEYAFGKRPQSMTKLKRLISHEFKIVNVIPQDKDPFKGNFVCITPNGARVIVNPSGSDAFKTQLLVNRQKHIGKDLTCDFYEWTAEGKPFHIVNNTIRDYE